jgi:prepilin-type processing-associated H-X9-DG protein
MADAATWANSGPTLVRTNQLAVPSSASTFHGIHNGFGNVLWTDGHVKPMRPVTPTVADGSGNTPAVYASHDLGALIPPSSVSTDKDYYFKLSK